MFMEKYKDAFIVNIYIISYHKIFFLIMNKYYVNSLKKNINISSRYQFVFVLNIHIKFVYQYNKKTFFLFENTVI